MAGVIVDFFAPAARLVVQLGLRVLRLEAQLVLQDIEAAVERVRAALG